MLFFWIEIRSLAFHHNLAKLFVIVLLHLCALVYATSFLPCQKYRSVNFRVTPHDSRKSLPEELFEYGELKSHWSLNVLEVSKKLVYTDFTS